MILHQESIDVLFFGIRTNVLVVIDDTFSSRLDFTIRGQSYFFIIESWRWTSNFQKLLQLFHGHAKRDFEQFGAIIKDNANRSVKMNFTNKMNMIMQAVKDVCACVEKLYTAYPSSMVGYATWYIEQQSDNEDEEEEEVESYSTYITKIACDCIVTCNLIPPNCSFPLVEFSD